MSSTNREGMFFAECERLQDKLKIIKSLPKSILEKYNYNFNKLINKIELLDSDLCEGKVYRFHETGYLNGEGYSRGYLYLFKGSSVKLHMHKTEEEYYIKVIGDSEEEIGLCKIGDSHEIKTVDEDTLIRTYKYIPQNDKKR